RLGAEVAESTWRRRDGCGTVLHARESEPCGARRPVVGRADVERLRRASESCGDAEGRTDRVRREGEPQADETIPHARHGKEVPTRMMLDALEVSEVLVGLRRLPGGAHQEDCTGVLVQGQSDGSRSAEVPMEHRAAVQREVAGHLREVRQNPFTGLRILAQVRGPLRLDGARPLSSDPDLLLLVREAHHDEDPQTPRSRPACEALTASAPVCGVRSWETTSK